MWHLERYARFIGKQQLFSGGCSEGSWKHFTSTSKNTIQLALVDVHHLIISCGSDTHESVSLWESSKWLRVIGKGDSALFIIKNKENNRRFRVKFSPLPSGGSSTEACKQCLSALSSFVPVNSMTASLGQPPKDTGSDGKNDQQTRPSMTSATRSQVIAQGKAADVSIPLATSCTSSNEEHFITINNMATILGDSGSQDLPDAYRSTNLPTDQLESFIRLCLTDSNFPGFVEAVDNVLQGIIEN